MSGWEMTPEGEKKVYSHIDSKSLLNYTQATEQNKHWPDSGGIPKPPCKIPRGACGCDTISEGVIQHGSFPETWTRNDVLSKNVLGAQNYSPVKGKHHP